MKIGIELISVNDGNVLKLEKIDKDGTMTFRYIESETKLNQLVKITDEQMKRNLKFGIFKQP